MKDSITTDINNIMKKHSLLKSKQDDTILELKARLENLKVLQMKTDDLSNRFNITCDNQSKEISYLKDDIHRKERDIHQLKIEQDNYTSDIKKTQSLINNLDLALGDLTRKNEWSVADMANTIRRLEESNYLFDTGNKTNQRLLSVQTAECNNLSISLEETRNSCVRRETDYNGRIKTNERNINIDRESMRSLQISNHDLTKS